MSIRSIKGSVGAVIGIGGNLCVAGVMDQHHLIFWTDQPANWFDVF